MFIYSAFGLSINSSIPLVGLPAGSDPSNVCVVKRDLDIDFLRKISTSDQVCWGNVEGVVPFIVRNGAEIQVDPRGAVSDEVLSGFVTGILMAILLRQRGLFPLHASCVGRGGIAIAFAGNSGWGKSTLAEYFHQRGYQVLCDDLLALRIDEGKPPLVIPGYPHIRLTQEVGTHIVDTFDELPPLPSNGNKRLRTVTQVEGRVYPLHRLYLLDGEAALETRVEPLDPGETFRELPQHVWATMTIEDPRSKARYLRQCATLINTVPVSRLRRVRTLESLATHFDVVERDLEANRVDA